MFKNECNEDVESFTDGLEHDKVKRNARQRVEHTEDLSACRLRRAITVTLQQRQATSLVIINIRANINRNPNPKP